MSTKQILRHVPVFKKTFCTLSARTYGEVFKYQKHVVISCKIYNRLLRLRESTISETFSNLSLQSTSVECNRQFSNSCRWSSHSSNFDLGSRGDLKKHTENNDLKQIQTEDPELESLIKETDEDFGNDSRKSNSETTVDEEEQKHKMKAADNNNNIDNDSQLERNLEDVNRKDPELEYDYHYQVAEDIEEYDYLDENTIMEQQVRSEKVLPISLSRGKNGVFDLHELITLLEHLGAENIVTVPIPHAANFCDDMVVVSAKSRRHLQAINDEMLWVHKRKKAKKDPLLVIEGLEKADWCAMDIGNIVLHIFYGDLREYYDIESLWLLGPDRDPKCQEQMSDPYILSAEDLFWMETGQAKGKVADQDNSSTTDKDKQVNLASAEESVSEKSDRPDKNQIMMPAEGNKSPVVE